MNHLKCTISTPRKCSWKLSLTKLQSIILQQLNQICVELENENYYLKSYIVLHYLSDFLCKGWGLLEQVNTHLRFCDTFTGDLAIRQSHKVPTQVAAEPLDFPGWLHNLQRWCSLPWGLLGGLSCTWSPTGHWEKGPSEKQFEKKITFAQN